jgi:hypothetical protein
VRFPTILLLPVILLGAIGETAVSGGPPRLASSPRKLDVTLLFHANQNLVPYGRVADRACFRGLLRTLRNHPSLKFQIHFSAPTMHDLLWFGDSTLQIVRQGAQDGQFEIFGSTYAQNIMYSTRRDTGDYEFNTHQIQFQKELIEKVLGVTPKAFWNAERVWTQNFVQLLADNGYAYVPVEDHILQSSGVTGSIYRPHVTRFNGRSVTVFEDDKTFLGLVDAAINSGNPSPVISFLNAKYAEDTLDQNVIGYYQDAEATGLWDYESGVDPQTNFSGLDALLKALEQDTLINVTTYHDWAASSPPPPELTPIVDGAAAWMGGDAWFAENQSPAFVTMRSLYDSLRTYIDSVATVIETFAADTAANKLIRHAWFTLCAHQFEFGCHGLEGDVHHTQLQLARASAVSATAALFRLLPATRSFLADVNRDGTDEIVVTTPRDLYVFSPSGGRLLYWFNLTKGEELVGDENFSADYGEPYVDDNLALPQIRGGIETYPWLAGNPLLPEVFTWSFRVRKRALNDHLSFNGGTQVSLENTGYTPTLDSAGATFSTIEYGLEIRKTVRALDDGLSVQYHLRMLSTPATVDLEVQNSFCPSLLSVMDNGRPALGYWDGGSSFSQSVQPSTVGVRNAVTGSGVRYRWDDIPDGVAGAEDVFALELNPTYRATLATGDSASFGFDLQARDATTGIQPHSAALAELEYHLFPNYPNPFNPTTVIRGQWTRDSRIRLAVYDVLGREVAVLANGRYPAGTYSFLFNGTNLASGVYYYRLTVDTYAATRNMLMMK